MDRLDNILVKRNLISSRTRAIYEIKNGNVYVNNEIVTKPSKKFDDNISIDIKNKLEYVSKGALKLLKALDTFNINLENKIMLDIGSSTGGFCDVALKNNIKKIIAVDVGKNQFDISLRNNEKIELHEETDIRNFVIKERIDIVTIDVSFISVTKILDKLSEIKTLNEIVLLIKPQFECGKEIADKYKGVPLNKEVHKNVIKNIINSFKKINFNIQDMTYSPIKGGSGNIEYLAYFTRNDISKLNLENVINKAFNLLKE